MKKQLYKQHARFWSKVNVGADAECWLWTGTTNNDGYGRIKWPDGSRRSSSIGAHRVAYELANDEEPGSNIVMHTCDNPICVNPAHLLLGTKKDNADDMVAKKRHCSVVTPDAIRSGEIHAWAKLKECDVKQIYSLIDSGERAQNIALRFGVKVANIYAITSGRSWKRLWRVWRDQQK